MWKIGELFLFLSCWVYVWSTSVSPTWQTSDYFQAANHAVINTRTGNGSRPSYTFPFNFSFPAEPHLGYGIKNYEGDDYMGEQFFQVMRSDLTSSSFSVEVQIMGYTHIWILNVPFIVVDPTFPHHLNSFDNVPLNYSNGELTNVTSRSSSTVYYTNTINYTQQASGRTYNTFQAPLSNNRILLFMTTLFIATELEWFSWVSDRPIDIYVTPTVISTDEYQLSISLKMRTELTRYHFSEIIFDVADVQASRTYFIVAEQLDISGSGDFIEIPSEFVSNFIMGLLDFSTQRSQAVLDFNWEFATVGGNFGVQVAASVPKSDLIQQALTRQGVTIFYIKTWVCPDDYFFDLDTDLCWQCSIANCIQCENTSHCYRCDEENQYFVNSSGLCEQCSLSKCSNCSSLTTCRQCWTNQSYYLIESGQAIAYDPADVDTCGHCDPAQNQFMDGDDCEECSLANCVTCASLTTCSLCDQPSNYFVNGSSECELCSLSNCITCSSLTQCSVCDTGSQYFLNTSDNTCVQCPVDDCSVCDSFDECNTCDSSANVYLNSTDKLCYPCPDNHFINTGTGVCDACAVWMSDCVECVSSTECSVCDYNNSYYVIEVGQAIAYDPADVGTCSYCNQTLNYFINSTTNKCQACTIQYCLNCNDFITCTQCNNTAQYFLNNTDNQCYACSVANCLSCDTIDECGLCDASADTYLNNTDKQCYPCPTNEFMNITSGTCQPCASFISDCITCVSSSQCGLCDSNSSFYVVEVGQSVPYDPADVGVCEYCNTSDNNFINSTSLACQPCTLTHCINCTDFYTCVQCNTTAQYFLNVSDDRCHACSIQYCVTCDTISECAECDDGANAYLNDTDKQCYLCPDNQLINVTSKECQPCATYLDNCITCMSVIQCGVCDSNSSYYVVQLGQVIPNNLLVNAGECDICNSSQNYYINETDLQCQECSLLHCLNCSDLFTCTQCNNTAEYFLNLTDNLCHPCTIPYCLNCDAIDECVECDDGANAYLNNTDKQCYICPSNQFINTTTKQCQECSLFVDNCVTCVSTTQCAICDINQSYYVVESGQIAPNNLLVNVGECDICNSSENYFINETDLSCQECSLVYCLNCSDLFTCTQCNNTAQYFLNLTDNLCHPCTIPYCLNCDAIDECVECDELQNAQLNTTDNQCHLCQFNEFVNLTTLRCESCQATLEKCLVCQSLFICSVCDYNESFYLIQANQTLPYNETQIGQCAYCNNSDNYFINMTNLQCELCTLSQCLTCADLDACSLCNQSNGYYLNTTSNLCEVCTLSQCLDCASLYECQLCNQTAQYFVNSTDGLCWGCSLEGCVNCSAIDVCQQCNNTAEYYFSASDGDICGGCSESCQCDGYFLPWADGKCTPQCGDGLIRVDEECDDNGTIDGDGCSSTCQIQTFYSCTDQPSNCFLDFHLSIQIMSIERTACNTFTLEMQIEPKLPAFAQPRLLEIITVIHDNISQFTQSYNSSTGVVTVVAQYSGDITNRTISIEQPFVSTLEVQYDPIVPPMYYSDEECQSKETVKKVMQSVQIVSYVIMFSSLLSCKIIGLELFGVLQLSFFDLSNYDSLNMFLEPLSEFKSFNGFNTRFKKNSNDNRRLQEIDDSALPESVEKLDLDSDFINNFNVMYLLMILVLVIAIVVWMIGKFCVWEKFKVVGMFLLKEVFLTLLIFNSFNIAFSAGLHWTYADPSSEFYVISSIALYAALLMIVIVTLCLELSDSDGYGEFKKKFKRSWPCQVYITACVIYRVVLGVYIATQSQYQQATLLVLAFSLFFLLYNFVNLPFKQTIHNYRSCLINVSIFIVLIVTNYYRSMKSTTPDEQKSHIYTPAIIQICAIMLCMLVSFFVLVYEIIMFCRKCCGKKQDSHEEVNITQESLDAVSLKIN